MSPVLSGQENSARKTRRLLPVTSIRRVVADGVRIFYREAGDAVAPVVLLLHGFREQVVKHFQVN